MKSDIQPCCNDIRKCRPVTKIKKVRCATTEPVDYRQFGDPRFNGSDCPYLLNNN